MAKLEWRVVDAYEQKADTPYGTFTIIRTIFHAYAVFFNGQEVIRNGHGGMVSAKDAAQTHYDNMVTSPEGPTQKLIDLVFEIAQASSEHGEPFRRGGQYDVAYHMTWVAKRLREGGYDTQTTGSSWGVLKK